MRRVILKLTEAQAALLRGGLRSHAEDMNISGMWTDTDARMAEDILRQLNQPAKEVGTINKR
jgi:hypothetical protein